MNKNKLIAGARRKYENGLKELAATPIGNRHNKLFGLARLGLWAGITANDLEDALYEAGNYTPGERNEIRRTIAKASESNGLVPQIAQRRTTTPTKAPTSPSVSESTLFRELVGIGGGSATFEDLRALSPGIVPVSLQAQAQAQLDMLFSDTRHKIWAGHLHDAKDCESVGYLHEWRWRIQLGAPIPPFLAANPVSGESMNGSYRNSATVAAYRHAVIEIDTLPLETQAAFWIGVIKKEMLPVRTLVYSGGKSIHGIIRLRDGESEWRNQWDTLIRCLATDRDPAYRIDAKCRDATRMTRFAGAKRADSGRIQELLWIHQ